LDTRSKNNKIPGITGILISLFLLSVLAVGVIAFYPVYLKGADNLMEKVKGQDEISKSEVIHKSFIPGKLQFVLGYYGTGQ